MISGTRTISRHLPIVSCLAGFSLNAQAAGSFTISDLSVVPEVAQPGQSVTFSVTITSSETVQNYPVELSWQPTGTSNGPSQVYRDSFTANQPVTLSYVWTVPAGTPPAPYTLYAGVYDPAWDVPAEAYANASFAVGGAPVAGVCGTSNNAAFSTAPSTNLCSVGLASAVSGNGPWTWSCAGSSGGATAMCQASLATNATNGACGAANGVAASAKPTNGLCSAGTASPITGSHPYTWTCRGENGGNTAQCFAPIAQTGRAPLPGLSAALSASPPYTCTKNVYVDAVNGNDSNPGTESEPWKNIYTANDGYPNTPVPGECVNVQPGLYTLNSTMVFSVGGASNTPFGYVVYRSVVPQAAHIIANFTSGDMIQLWAPYIIVDGFEIDGNKSMTSGSGLSGCTCGGQSCNIAHHFTAINNIIHDMGGAGLSTCTADYIQWTHNVVYNTSSTDPWEVSALDVWEPKTLAPGSFTPTQADDAAFGLVLSYNIVHDNMEGNNGHATHTDGNGIIIDTTLGSDTCPTCGTPYGGHILVVGNLTYNNGGGGVHVFLSSNVVAANNTAYNNHLDPLNTGTARGELSSIGSANIHWINNIGYAVPGAGVLSYNGPIVAFPVGNFPSSGWWKANIGFGGPVQLDPGETGGSGDNLFGVNPLLRDPAADDFMPLLDSPAIGGGVPRGYLPVTPPDIGAY
jgi:hypothetical protein